MRNFRPVNRSGSRGLDISDFLLNNRNHFIVDTINNPTTLSYLSNTNIANNRANNPIINQNLTNNNNQIAQQPILIAANQNMAANITNVQLNALFNALQVADVPRGIGASLPFATGKVIDVVATAWGLGSDMTGIVMMGMIARVSEMAAIANVNMVGVAIAANNPNDLTFTAAAVIGGITCGNANIDTANPALLIGNDAAILLRRVFEAYNNATRWIFDLVGSNQVGQLSPENVGNYFKSANIHNVNGNVVLRLINPLSTIIAKIVADDGARGRLSNIDWVRYHTSATSTPQLVQRAIDFIGNSIPNFWNAATLPAVTAAIAAPWNKELAALIPRKAVAATHAILSALNMAPRGWVQGEKAKALVPASTYFAWVKIADKIQGIISNQRALDAAIDINQVNAAINPACLNC